MQAQSLFIGGIPMLFYGGEAGYTNDYSFKEHGTAPVELIDRWTCVRHPVGADDEGLVLDPYGFLIATAAIRME